MSKIKRIAICFSGQLRTWQFSAENILKYFEPRDNIKVDYFIHTWDINMWMNSKQKYSNIINEKHNDIQKVINTYKPVSWVMSRFDDRRKWFIWEPLFYSFQYSMLLKQQYELENNFTYDMVIKTRPDVIYDLNKKFSFDAVIEDRTCYTVSPIKRIRYEFSKHSFDDVMFFAKSSVMDIVAGIYKYYRGNIVKCYSKKHIDSDICFLGPSSLLHTYLTKHNIHPDFRHVEYAIVRQTMLDQGLDPLKDYQKLKKISMDWYHTK